MSCSKIYYLEIVTPNVEPLCEVYRESLGISFSEPVQELGQAKTAQLTSGELLGIRAPLHKHEKPTTRPYYLVSDIQKTITQAESSGAVVAVPPMEIPGYGQCAIIINDTIESGFWQL